MMYSVMSMGDMFEPPYASGLSLLEAWDFMWTDCIGLVPQFGRNENGVMTLHVDDPKRILKVGSLAHFTSAKTSDADARVEVIDKASRNIWCGFIGIGCEYETTHEALNALVGETTI